MPISFHADLMRQAHWNCDPIGIVIHYVPLSLYTTDSLKVLLRGKLEPIGSNSWGAKDRVTNQGPIALNAIPRAHPNEFSQVLHRECWKAFAFQEFCCEEPSENFHILREGKVAHLCYQQKISLLIIYVVWWLEFCVVQNAWDLMAIFFCHIYY